MPKKGQTKPKHLMRARYRKMRVDGIQVSVHRYLMEQHLGRSLLSNELVHHINGDRYDNRLENLEVQSPKQHSREHNLGRKHSAETRAKMSAAHIGRQYRKGFVHPEETKKKISESVKKTRREKFWSSKKKS
jgi:hypothetical protein